MESKFIKLCGSCFNPINKSGLVLSCGDFLCDSCKYLVQQREGSACPACRKTNIKFLDLNCGDIPQEINDNLSSCSDQIETLYSAVDFQLKSYKKIIKGLLNENRELKTTIRGLKRPREGDQNLPVRPATASQAVAIPHWQPRENQIPLSLDGGGGGGGGGAGGIYQQEFRQNQRHSVMVTPSTSVGRPQSASGPPDRSNTRPLTPTAGMMPLGARPQGQYTMPPQNFARPSTTGSTYGSRYQETRMGSPQLVNQQMQGVPMQMANTYQYQQMIQHQRPPSGGRPQSADRPRSSHGPNAPHASYAGSYPAQASQPPAQASPQHARIRSSHLSIPRSTISPSPGGRGAFEGSKGSEVVSQRDLQESMRGAVGTNADAGAAASAGTSAGALVGKENYAGNTTGQQPMNNGGRISLSEILLQKPSQST